jgi:hypothetical protein
MTKHIFGVISRDAHYRVVSSFESRSSEPRHVFSRPPYLVSFVSKVARVQLPSHAAKRRALQIIATGPPYRLILSDCGVLRAKLTSPQTLLGFISPSQSNAVRSEARSLRHYSPSFCDTAPRRQGLPRQPSFIVSPSLSTGLKPSPAYPFRRLHYMLPLAILRCLNGVGSSLGTTAACTG